MKEKKKWTLVPALMFALLVFAMLPQTVLAREQAETIDTTGGSALFTSDHFEITPGLFKDNCIALYNDSAGYPVKIRSKSDNNITKVELRVANNTGVSINTIKSTDGVVSGSTSVGSSVVISKINASALQIGTTDTGAISIDQIKIYYDDLSSYAGTTDSVIFNGLEWYVISYSPDDKTVDLLTKDCIGVSQFNPPETNFRYKNSTVESYLKKYYDEHFSAVDSAVISVEPIYNSLNGPEPEGNIAKLWLLGVSEAYHLPAGAKTCKSVPGTDNYWWLREAGTGAYQVYIVSCTSGEIKSQGDVDKMRGVRPALRLALASVSFTSESKTISLKKAPAPTPIPSTPTPTPTSTPAPTPTPTRTPTPTPTADDTQNIRIRLNSKLKADWTGSTVSASWDIVPGADEYEVYAAYCGAAGYSKIKAGKKTSVAIKKLNGRKLDQKKEFKLYVAAKADGRILAKSIVLHVAGPKNKQYTNVKEISLTKKEIQVKAGKKAAVQAKLVLVNKSKKTLPSYHAAKFRYASSDKTIATVDKNGKVKGVKKGSCYIYVYAVNGFARKVKVTVR